MKHYPLITAKLPALTSTILICILLASCDKFSLKPRKEEPAPYVPEVEHDTVAHYDFEQGLGDWPEKDVCCNWSATVSDSVQRDGRYSLKLENRLADKLIDPSREKYGPSSVFGLKPNDRDEGWFGFSTYFPNTFVKDTIQDVIASWQSLPDFDLGEEWRSPPLVLGVLSDSLILEVRTDRNAVTGPTSYSFTRLNLGKVQKSQWLDWVFHIKWSYEQQGVIEIWKNGKLVMERKGLPNAYNDRKYPFFKIGLYSLDWPKNPPSSSTRTMGAGYTRTIFIDAITVGSKNLNYNLVVPGK